MPCARRERGAVAERMDVVLAGEPMVLLGARALYWPARRRVLIADLHLGKADVFRGAGIGLPSGGTQADLARLADVVAATQATSVWVLGDFLHGATIDTRWRVAWDGFRAAHAALEVGVLAGNHDRALRRAALDVELLGDAVDDGPFALRHAPEPRAGRHVLCGHLHPAVRVPGLPGRWPAFWLQPAQAVLPAYALFTGGSDCRAQPGEVLVACARGLLVRVPG